MTEQKPVAWICEYRSGFSPNNWLTDLSEHRPKECETIRNVEPLYRHPAPPTEQKPVAWIYDTAYPGMGSTPALSFDKLKQDHPFVNGPARPLYEHPALPTEQEPVAWSSEIRNRDDGVWWTDFTPLRPIASVTRRNIRPLYDRPAPARPVTDPAVEAARRKALRAIFNKLGYWPFACDTATGTELPFGVLRDLVGQPRKYPNRAIRGYDNDGPPGPHPVFGKREPALLSVPMLASIIANRLEGVPAWSTQTVANVARAVHAAVYGKDAE